MVSLQGPIQGEKLEKATNGGSFSKPSRDNMARARPLAGAVVTKRQPSRRVRLDRLYRCPHLLERW
jgi:hypothetical protein